MNIKYLSISICLHGTCLCHVCLWFSAVCPSLMPSEAIPLSNSCYIIISLHLNISSLKIKPPGTGVWRDVHTVKTDISLQQLNSPEISVWHVLHVLELNSPSDSRHFQLFASVCLYSAVHSIHKELNPTPPQSSQKSLRGSRRWRTTLSWRRKSSDPD